MVCEKMKLDPRDYFEEFFDDDLCENGELNGHLKLLEGMDEKFGIIYDPGGEITHTLFDGDLDWQLLGWIANYGKSDIELILEAYGNCPLDLSNN